MAKKKKAAPKKKKAAKKKLSLRKKSPTPRKRKRAKRRPRGQAAYETPSPLAGRGLGAGAAGQSGDLQGLSRAEGVDSESVEELTEEGQDYEAEVVSGVENALDPDEGEVRTHRYIPPKER